MNALLKNMMGEDSRWIIYLCKFTVLDILLSVEKPVWDFVLARILDDGHHSFNLKMLTFTLIYSYNLLMSLFEDLNTSVLF